MVHVFVNTTERAGPLASITHRSAWLAAFRRMPVSMRPALVVGDPRTVTPDIQRELGFRYVSVEDVISDHRGHGPASVLEMAQLISHPMYLDSLWVFQKLVDRADYGSASLTNPDREALFLALVQYYLEAFLSGAATSLICGEAPHDPNSWAAYVAADWLGRWRLVFQQLGLSAPATSLRIGIGGARIPLGAGREKVEHQGTDEASRGMSALLDVIEGRRPMPYMAGNQDRYIIRRADRSGVEDYGRLAQTLQVSLEMLTEVQGFISRRPVILRAAIEALARSVQPPYAYFPLQFEPERTSVPEGGTFSNQLKAVLAVREFVPEDIPLLVGEHQTQLRRPTLGRSPLLYGVVARLPNTHLAPADLSSAELLDDACCVFSLTGTVLLEAAFRGIPAVSLGHPWFEGAPGVTPFGDGLTWASILDRAPIEGGELRDWLMGLVAEFSIPFMPIRGGRQWKRLSADGAKAEISALARALEAGLEAEGSHRAAG